MDFYPPTCQGDLYGFNMAGALHGHPDGPYSQHPYPSYLYTPQNNPHLYMNYNQRPPIPLQTPDIMGPSMRMPSSSQPFLHSLENGDTSVSLAQGDYLLCNSNSLKRPSGEEELIAGDSNFNVEQFLNVTPSSRKPDA